MKPTKKCTRCDRLLPLTAFGKHRLSHDGHAWQCKECNKQRAREWAKTPMGIYSHLKGLNKYYNRRPVVISKEDFVEWYVAQPKFCAYCDIPEELVWIMREYYGVHADRLTIDCMDNSTSYVKGNLVLSCMNCNRMKSKVLTFDEMRDVGQKYIKPKWMEIASTTAKRSE